MSVLVTGGTGYIGSHTVLELLANNRDVIIIDNFSNSKREVLDSLKKLSGKTFKFYEGDCRDKKILKKIFEENFIDSVINFAGYKAVGESCAKPLMYYNNNLEIAIALLEIMQEYGCKKFIFSSTAVVYGDPEILPVSEACKVRMYNKSICGNKTHD